MDMHSTPPRAGAVERLLRHDGLVVAGSALLIVIGASWYTVSGIGMNMSAVEMTRMAGPIGDPMRMPAEPGWSPGYAFLILMMWWVMMIAMMTPSAAPTVLLFAALKRMGPEKTRSAAQSLCFLIGYLVAWAVFSLVATGLQWGLEQTDLSNGPMMTVHSKSVAGGILVAAGIYQFSYLKTACLRQCQSPAQFLIKHNRPGASGAFRTGVHHGLYCIGCCWALMALLFVGGVMNLFWIVGVALYVAAEKLLPPTAWLAPITGTFLITIGIWFIAEPFFAPN